MSTNERTWLSADPTIAHINFGSKDNLKRAEELTSIPRFQGTEMEQRTTDGEHIIRVIGFSTIASEALLESGFPINQSIVMWNADYHDEPERGTGDVITPVKMAMTAQEKEAFDAWEMEIMHELEETLDKPTWAQSAAGIYEKYRRKDTVEARLVNFFDKWDASNEAVHELICGGAGKDFDVILGRYQKIIADLREKNQDWLPIVENFFGEGIFSVPTREEIQRRQLEDVKFDTVGSFLNSIIEGNPDSYGLWLGFNSYFWSTAFIERTFPGWVDKIPQPIIRAARLVEAGISEYRTPAGLIIDTDETRRAMRFAESMKVRSTLSLLEWVEEISDELSDQKKEG